jgi:uncharacterized protein (TIGR02996 family)
LLALLDGVRVNPDDLTPWLVLCDWLEENGDEADRARSEYCRLCFDKLGKTVYASDWEAGERRRDLYRRYKQEWFGPILALQVTMKKGLASVGSIWTATSRHLIEALQVEEPWAWAEGLYWYSAGFETEKTFTDLAWSPGLSCLRRLTLRCDKLSVPNARALAESPYLKRLVFFELNVTNPREGSTEARELLHERFGEVLRIR